MIDDLTGERRYRWSPCGFIVEVEYAYFDAMADDSNGWGKWKFAWRKAKADDLEHFNVDVIMHNESE